MALEFIKPHLMQAIAWYPFNESYTDIIDNVYGEGHHESYIAEKLGILTKRGLLFFYTQLDTHHRNVLCELIEIKYKKYLHGEVAKDGVS